MIDLETLAVAVISGLGGGLLGTWLQTRHERREAFRARLASAADDFVTDLQEAFIGLRDAEQTVSRHEETYGRIRSPHTGKLLPAVDNALKRANDRIDDVHRRVPARDAPVRKRQRLGGRLPGRDPESQRIAWSALRPARPGHEPAQRVPPKRLRNAHRVQQVGREGSQGHPWYSRLRPKPRYSTVYHPPRRPGAVTGSCLAPSYQ
jgi:hypothetical protein